MVPKASPERFGVAVATPRDPGERNLVDLSHATHAQDFGALSPTDFAPVADVVEFPGRAKLTGRQRAILTWVTSFVEARGYAPTLREIGTAFGIRSTNGVNDHLRALEKKGFIRRRAMQSRALTVVDSPHPGTVAVDQSAEWRAENEALRILLRRVQTASARLPAMTAEMVVVLGDVRDALACPSPRDGR